jgi:hypothetical protein
VAYLEEKLRQLPASDRATVTLAMRILTELFTGGKNPAKK